MRLSGGFQSSVLSFIRYEKFGFSKVLIRYFQSRSILSGVSAAQMRLHLSYMNVIAYRYLVFWLFCKNWENNGTEKIDPTRVVLPRLHQTFDKRCLLWAKHVLPPPLWYCMWYIVGLYFNGAQLLIVMYFRNAYINIVWGLHWPKQNMKLV